MPSHASSHRARRQPSPRQSAARKGLLLIATTMAVAAAAFAVAPSAAGTFTDASADRPAGSSAVRAQGDPAAVDRAGGNGRASRADRVSNPAAGSLAPTTGSSATTSSGSAATSSSSGSGEDAGGSYADPPVPAGPGASTGDRVYIGSVAGGYDKAVAGTGVQLANHAYAFFSGKVPQAAMVTVSAGGTKWRDVANAGPGSTLYNQIVSWAQTIKARGNTIMLAYNHEPEAHDRLTLGSAADFIAAWRHVRSIFDQVGVTNVQWTWQMTAYSFRVKSTSEQAAAKWYPGDEWVDNIGADAYNWISCGATGTGQYNELQFLGDPVLAFARAHGKKASFPEFASDANSNRVQWLANAHRYLAANSDILTAAFYFNRPPTIAANAECRWGLTDSAEFGQLRAMAQDAVNFKV